MTIGEPTAIALILLAGGMLLAISALISRFSAISGVPVLLFFLVIGMLAGSEGLGGIYFEDYSATFRIGTAALVLILFDGGLNTSFAALRQGVRPAAVLATIGVVLTAAFVACAAYAFGLPLAESLLLGAIVSSTDAAAVLSVLRGSGLSLRKRTGTTLELESGLNDPVAVILTMAATAAAAEGQPMGFAMVGNTLLQLAIGILAGVLIGKGGAWLLRKVHFMSAGLYPVLTLGTALIAFAVPTLAWGSGFLSVYIAAMFIGNAQLPHGNGLRRVHDAMAWFSQVSMFLLLGLLVFPSRLMDVAPLGLCLALVLTFVVRPLAVLLCLLPFRFPWRDTVFIGWVGLRGAVPILLATFPILAQVEGSHRIFDLVFFIVVVNAIIPGATVAWVTRRLGLEAKTPPPPEALLEIDTHHQLNKNLVSFFLRPQAMVVGMRLADIAFPEETSAVLIIRGKDIITPKGRTVLCEGDHVYVLCTPADLPLLYLMFGEPEVD